MVYFEENTYGYGMFYIILLCVFSLISVIQGREDLADKAKMGTSVNMFRGEGFEF